jgi:hypothetical protein
VGFINLSPCEYSDHILKEATAVVVIRTNIVLSIMVFFVVTPQSAYLVLTFQRSVSLHNPEDYNRRAVHRRGRL